MRERRWKSSRRGSPALRPPRRESAQHRADESAARVAHSAAFIISQKREPLLRSAPDRAVSAPALVIYGVGAVARLVYSHVRRHRSVLGFTVDDAVIASGGAEFCSLPLAPWSVAENAFDPAACEMLIAVGFQEMNGLRVRKHAEAKAKGYSFATYVDPSVTSHDGVEIAENCIILEHVSIHPGCRLGPSVFVSSNVNLGHDCEIGEGAWINAGVNIGGGTRIGAGGFLGVGAAIGHGVTLGPRVFVGANTLIDRDVEADAVMLSPPGEKFRLKSEAFLRFARLP